MSNFQIGLAVAGGLALVAVVGYNTWTSRKNAPLQADTPPVEPAGLGPLEPTFSEEDVQAYDKALPTPLKKPTLDALIDVIASLALDPNAAVVSGDAAIAALPATRRAGTKPFAVEGFNMATQQWEAPVAGQRYSSFQAGVQLANRSGALNEIEYSEFVVKTQAFADAIGAMPDFPEMRDEVARARELDQFASAHDAQLGFTIRATHASWSPGYVNQNAARQGFVPGAIAGRMVLPSAQEGTTHPLLVLSFDSQAALAEDPAQAAIREISLHLDVAHADRAEQPFERMRDAAFALAQSMGGVVTDDNAQPLAPASMDLIGAELQTLYTTLEQRDLAAGSAVARRLFS
jgi:ZipA, C-terminal FtsZ-binding domain